ncbi:tRNA pseudouridine(55) synthase TruB [Buchnera aphidicola (Mollitrichosiphum nigrofasciatum)]|uniref:tRNA pseudouridine(55) synthase TruB n=1 Tax=Buchnera aphidicola TaxID=9 RepID=UPI0031B8A19E
MCYQKINKLNGVLLLDKPTGFSCNYIIQSIKRFFSVKKIGYIGTLDPLATGTLPVCFGCATKFSKYLNDEDKKYIVTAKLGEKTHTSDSYGYIISKKKKNISNSKILKCLMSFLGMNKQSPSMYSSIKFYGIPLYIYARQNIFIPNIKRIINIYNINILNLNKKFITFKIHCSKGTYIRTLVEDFGNKLGCGAHVVMLRRLHISCYYESNLISYNKILNISYKERNKIELIKNLLLPVDSLTSFLPKVFFDKNKLKMLKLGKKIFILYLNIGFYTVFEKLSKKFFGVGKYKKDGYFYIDRIF